MARGGPGGGRKARPREERMRTLERDAAAELPEAKAATDRLAWPAAALTIAALALLGWVAAAAVIRALAP